MNIAVDALAEYFIPKDDEDSIKLKEYYDRHKEKLDTPEGVNFFICQMVWNRVDSEVININKEIDPIFGKICNSINYYLKNSDFEKKNVWGTVCIISKHNKNIFPSIIDDDNFSRIPLTNFCHPKFDNVIEDVLKFIQFETKFSPAIPFNSLVKKIKSIAMNDYEKDFLCIHNQFIELLDINKAISKSLSKTKRYLENQYLNKHKIDEKDFVVFDKILFEFTRDMLNGGVNSGLFDYWKDFDKGIDEEKFYSHYYGILNYLIKNLKKNIESELNFSKN